MDPDRYERLMRHFDEACDLAPAEQEAHVARLAEGDPRLAGDLAALLRHDAGPGGSRTSLHAGALLGPAAGDFSLAGPGWPTVATDSSGPAPAWVRAALGGEPDLEVLSTLAEGGMGRVLLARQRSLQREVAVKVLKPQAASLVSVESLLAEAVLAGSLEHPNIVPVHLLERDAEGLPLLVMKRVEGVSWGALITQPDHPAWARLPTGGDRLAAHLSILTSVCNALHFAHSRGVVHRDVKPDNVMVGAFGEVYLVDWGIAAQLGGAAAAPAGADPLGGRMVGTPGYMAPEMVLGDSPPDARTDVYLLGATLHHVLTGGPRHGGRTVLAMLMAARESRPVDYGPEVPEELGALCNRATDPDPARRPPSAAAFRDAVADYLQHRGANELSTAAWERLRELQAAIAAKEPAPPARLHELMTECQFGFHQSLRAWPEGGRARQGLRECLRTMLEHEIAQGHLARAEALFAQLDDAPTELTGQLVRLRGRVREREAGEARLRELERAQDWSISARQRAFVLLLSAVLGLAIFVVAVYDVRGTQRTLPPRILALSMGLGALCFGLLVLLFRRHIFATAVTRGLVLGLLCGTGFFTLHRALHGLPAPRTADIVSDDQLLAAFGFCLGGIMLARWLWLLAPFYLAGAVLSRLFPVQAGVIFAVCGVSSLLAGLAAIRRLGAPRR